MQTHQEMEFFKRQKGIDGWNQELLENQIALCLGMVLLLNITVFVHLFE